MCMSDSPAIPAPVAPPPPPQEAKTPDRTPEIAEAKRKRSANANTTIEGGTLLTGPTGIANTSLTTGGGSLLGG